MSSSKVMTIIKLSVIALNILAFLAFVFSLIILTTDPQGVFIFLFSVPIICILIALAIYLAKKLFPNNKMYLNLSQLTPIILISFCLVGFIPGLKKIPETTIQFLIQGFTLTMGKSPRQYFSDRNNLKLKIEENLKSSSGLVLDFSKITTAYEWSKICIFTLYTSDPVADQLTQIKLQLSLYSDINSSDSIHTVILLNEKSMTNYLNIYRSEIDFDLKESICLQKSDALFYKKDHLFGLKK